MKQSLVETQTLFTMHITSEYDIVQTRQTSRQVANLLKFGLREQAQLATAVSEIARNAWNYARGGDVEFSVQTENNVQNLLVTIRDNGPGFENLDDILAGRTAGQGISGARRLVDEFEIESIPGKGTNVKLMMRFPQREHFDVNQDFEYIRQILLNMEPQSAFEEIRRQNQELVLAMEELQQRQQELARLNRELEDTNRGVIALYVELEEKAESLRQADATKTRFLSNVSHELRTPINSIMALSKIIISIATENENGIRRPAELISKSAQSLAELVNDLLDLEKILSGKIEVKVAPVDVRTMFSALRGMLRFIQTDDRVDLVFEEPEDFPVVHTDEGKLSQILRNFITNGLKFTEEGEVRVSAELDRTGHVLFSVKDTGVGIPAEDQERIFEEFVQVYNPLQQSRKGTGLGLSICRKLSELLHGSISVQSEPGKGSTFTVSIPVRHDEPTTAGAEAATPVDTAEMPSGVVIVIDDDEASRYLISENLKDTRYSIVEAKNGTEGIQKVQEHNPIAILLDLMMPGIDGFEVLRRLKSDTMTQAIPVIIVTSKHLAPDERRQLGNDALALVSKEELSGSGQATIRDLLVRAHAMKESRDDKVKRDQQHVEA